VWLPAGSGDAAFSIHAHDDALLAAGWTRPASATCHNYSASHLPLFALGVAWDTPLLRAGQNEMIIPLAMMDEI
jgi:hypothetical protein